VKLVTGLMVAAFPLVTAGACNNGQCSVDNAFYDTTDLGCTIQGSCGGVEVTAKCTDSESCTSQCTCSGSTSVAGFLARTKVCADVVDASVNVNELALEACRTGEAQFPDPRAEGADPNFSCAPLTDSQ
jgi:hypothetical protein